MIRGLAGRLLCRPNLQLLVRDEDGSMFSTVSIVRFLTKCGWEAWLNLRHARCSM